METNQEEPTREQLLLAALRLGELVAQVGDFYDVAEEIARGYAWRLTGKNAGPCPPAHTGSVKSAGSGVVAVEAFSSPDQEEPAATIDLRLELRFAALHELQSVSGNLIAELVGNARARYWTWEMIGEALEISKQAAQQRFAAGE